MYSNLTFYLKNQEFISKWTTNILLFIPPKSERPQKVSKGKLSDFYRNRLDECRQITLHKKMNLHKKMKENWRKH